MPRIRTGNIQHRGTSYRLRYTDNEGIRRHETYKTRREAERALLAYQVAIGLRSIPSAESTRVKLEGVYFIQSETGLVKIGCSANLDRRISSLISQSSVKLTLLRKIETADYLKLERKLHRIFHAERHHGEWFQISKADIDRALIRNEFPGFLPSSALLGVGL